MSEPFIIDAHLHTGEIGLFFTPESGFRELLARMDRLSISHGINAGSWSSLMRGGAPALAALCREHEQSGGRLFYLGAFDPRRAADCLRLLEKARAWPGFQGIKLHPSFHQTPAEDPAYEAAWRFAAEHDLAVLAHSWSVSGYNPAQALSTPERLEGFVCRWPEVRFVLVHAGGRGGGRREAVRMTREHPNVYLDLAGDVFCLRLVETLCRQVPAERLLFGSDFPWLDPRCNLTRVLLADLPASARLRILQDNTVEAYRLRL